MSVIMTLRLKGDPGRLEQFAAANAERLTEVSEVGKRHGVIAHRFYGNEDAIMVVDEWPDRESFESFFAEAGERIQSIMAEVGAEGAPQIDFWRKLETGDEVGWNS